MDARKKITVEEPRGLYRWAKLWNRKQRDFFVGEVTLRREKQIRDFICLNGFQRVRFKVDTDVFQDHPSVEHSTQAELVVITDQKFSRFPCEVLITKIQQQLEKCPRLYLCLNRHYINIDDTYQDAELDSNLNRAITQWLQRSLPGADIIDLSLDYLDRGDYFTWALPDRHYYIRYAQNN